MKSVFPATMMISAMFLANIAPNIAPNIAHAQESEMMSAAGNNISIGGYYEFGYVKASDDADLDDGSDSKTYGDSELFIDFEASSDHGLVYGVQIDLETVNGSRHAESGTASNAEEASLYVSGGFGALHLGHDDNAYGRFLTWAPTHEGATSQDDNVLFGGGRFIYPAGNATEIATADAALANARAADRTARESTTATQADRDAAADALAEAETTRRRIGGGAHPHYLAHSAAGQGAAYEDNAKITYISPGFSGFQFAVSLMDSDTTKDNPAALGVSYGASVRDVALAFTAAAHTNNAEGMDKERDGQVGVTASMGDLTLTAARYQGRHFAQDMGIAKKKATELGIGYQVNEDVSVGASLNKAQSEGDVDQEGDFGSISGAYSIAPGLKTTLAMNAFDISDERARVSNDGSELTWQLEFSF